jgi:LPXTG-site transpeptidase (sortase) family protein
MHAFRLRACLLSILLVLALSACGSASRTEVPEVRISQTTNANTTPKVLPVGKTDSVSNAARLIIPAIAINASIEGVGTQPNADLATPAQNPWRDVGWYNQGPQPGEKGSAVIDGHLDRPGGIPAVFWNLRDLHVGDEVLIKNTSGKTIRFQVTRIEFYPPQDAPIQDIFGNWGGTYLNLITCAGDWIPSQHQTNLRLVVYTSLAKVSK